ncbi:hypothetical protein [Xanthocytophaga flava]|uniref:hypothetical protein n=1 Tax=Xanthocytophaga flava TaxID=3048013 RepID=UPI0028D35644|nr:hypothetical protein [Xanthocytophaga flavus]MDJ1469020.1 hypothetical protein [Xanthocytophaga flavus]
MKSSVKFIYYFFAFLWLVSLLAGPFFTFFPSAISCELPWFDISNVIVDQKGNTYIGLPFYGRVQLYDKEGNFRKQWHIGHGNGGSFRLILSPNQYIEVATAQGRSLNTFDSKGKLIKVKHNTDLFHRLDDKRTHPFVDRNKNEYGIKDKVLFPEIIRKSPSGKEDLVAKMPWYLFFIHPFYTVCCLVVSGLMQWVTNKRKNINY